MNAGKLRHLLKVYCAFDVYTEKADDEITYPDAPNLEIYGSIECLQGRELLVAQQMRADLSHKITMRFNRIADHRCKVTWFDGVVTRTFHLGPGIDAQTRNIELAFYAYEIK